VRDFVCSIHAAIVEFVFFLAFAFSEASRWLEQLAVFANGFTVADGQALANPIRSSNFVVTTSPTSFPIASHELAPFRKPVGILFLSLSLALALAGIGWLKRRKWGWQLAVAIIATQVLGDCANIFLGCIVPGALGVAIAAALLFYITRASVRCHFQPKRIVHATAP